MGIVNRFAKKPEHTETLPLDKQSESCYNQNVNIIYLKGA